MSFDWMEPTAVVHDGAAVFKEKYKDEFLRRAELLRRLGYSKTDALTRCKSRVAWEFEHQGDPPLSDRELGALLKDVYGV